MDTTLLERIGLTQGEIKVYLSLLVLGPSTAGAIAKQAQVSRSKIYLIADRLEKKGLASHVDKRGVRCFQAVEPSKITDYLTERKEELESLGTDFQKLLPQLEAFHSEAGKGHLVTIYQGVKGLRVAHEHTYLKLRKDDEYYVLGAPGMGAWKETDRYWVKDHKRRVAAGIKCKILFNANVERQVVMHRNRQPLCEARFMPIGMVTPAEMEIYKDTTLIMMLSDDPITVELIGQDIADSFKAYFEQFWKLSKRF